MLFKSIAVAALLAVHVQAEAHPRAMMPLHEAMGLSARDVTGSYQPTQALVWHWHHLCRGLRRRLRDVPVFGPEDPLLQPGRWLDLLLRYVWQYAFYPRASSPGKARDGLRRGII